MVEDLVAQCFLMIFGLLCDEVVLCGLNAIWYERNCIIYPLTYADETPYMVALMSWYEGF